MHYLDESNILIFLVQLFVILGLAKGLGEIFRRWRQPPLTAEILVGVLLGPTFLERFFPGLHSAIFPADRVQQNMLETVGWLGVLFLLMEAGLEIDFSSAWRQRGEALTIALADIIIPMVIAFIPCVFLPDHYLTDPNRRLIFALFMATVMTISAMPITARALRDLRFYKSDLGYLIMSALSVNDIIGWLIFTLVLGLFTQVGVQAGAIFWMVFLTFGFAVFCLSLGRPAAERAISTIHSLKMPEPASSLTLLCLVGFICGAITQWIGIHALFGFFLAGIMVGEARSLPERTRQVISQMVYAIFVPFFFAGIGLKLDFLRNFDPALVLLLTGVGIAGRFYGAWAGVNMTNVDRSNRLTIAIAHIPGGMMEIVIAVLALENHLITEPVFVAIVFSAVISSIVMGPWMSYSLGRRRQVSVAEFFPSDAVLPELGTVSRKEAIRKLCAMVAEREEVADAETIFKAVWEREEMMGTAIEEGVALPHARFTFLTRPLIAFGRSSTGIEWDSPDGLPGRFIFLVLTSPSDDLQVQILGSIARVMSDAGIQREIMAARDARGIRELLRRAFTLHHVVRR